MNKLARDKFIAKHLVGVNDVSAAISSNLIAEIWKAKSFAIKISPPLQSSGTRNEAMAHNTILCNQNVRIWQNMLIADYDEDVERKVAFEFFSKVMSFANIVGLTFPDVERDDLIGINEPKTGHFVLIASSKGMRRGEELRPVEVSVKELKEIVYSINILWDAFKGSNLHKAGDFYRFLGLCRYYFYTRDYFLSFILGWIFIEAMIGLIWEKMIDSKFKVRNGSPLERKRDFTASIRIDELFMNGWIDGNTYKTLHHLRKKRNDIFHADQNPERRISTQSDCIDCMKVGLKMFYEGIGLSDTKVIDFEDLRLRILASLRMPAGSKKIQ